MEPILDFFKRPFIKRIFILILIGFMLLLIKNQLTLFLLTFIFIYLINSAEKQLSALIGRLIKVPRRIVIIFLYLIIVGILFLVIYNFVPEIIRQITDIVKSVTHFITNYDTMTKTEDVLLNDIYGYFKQIDLQKYIESSGSVIISFVSSVGGDYHQRPAGDALKPVFPLGEGPHYPIRQWLSGEQAQLAL